MPGVRLADARDRAPELVEVLRLPARDAGVGHRDVDEREQPRAARPTFRSASGRDRDRDLVVEPRRRAEARRAVVGPVDARDRLVRACGSSACRDAVAAERLHLVVGGRVRRRSSSAAAAGARNWSARRQHERQRRAPQCAPSASGCRLIGSWRQNPGWSLQRNSSSRAARDAAIRRSCAARGSRPRRPPGRARCRSPWRRPLVDQRRGPPRARRRTLPVWAGKSATSVSCAACAIAARARWRRRPPERRPT